MLFTFVDQHQKFVCLSLEKASKKSYNIHFKSTEFSFCNRGMTMDPVSTEDPIQLKELLYKAILFLYVLFHRTRSVSLSRNVYYAIAAF